MTKEELNEITNKLIKLADETREKDSYNRGYVDGLYQALRVFRIAFFGEVKNEWEDNREFIELIAAMRGEVNGKENRI